MRRITVNLPDDLADILTECQTRERYRSPSETIASFIRHWAISQQEHALTGPWASLPGPERDKIDAGLRELVITGKGKRGSWLKARIYDAIKDMNGSDAKSPTVDQVLRTLPDIIRRRLTAGE